MEGESKGGEGIDRIREGERAIVIRGRQFMGRIREGVGMIMGRGGGISRGVRVPDRVRVYLDRSRRVARRGDVRHRRVHQVDLIE